MELAGVGQFGGWEEGSYWTGASSPAIAIIPTSATTAAVIEAGPWAASTPPGIPQCSVPEHPSNRSTRAVGDIIVYDVDLNATYRPLLLVEPIIAVVSPAYLQAVTGCSDPFWLTIPAAPPAAQPRRSAGVLFEAEIEVFARPESTGGLHVREPGSHADMA